MTVHKAQINLPSGETVRLYLWDAKTSLGHKESRELALIDEKSKEFFSLGATKPSEYRAQSEQLIQDYLRSGTYHLVIFVFDPSLIVVDKVFNRTSFQQMEHWFDTYKTLCAKSWQGASILFVGNTRKKGQNEELKERIELDR